MKKCPTCNKQVEWQDNPFRPFCSERCKLVDLGKWVSEEYRVPGRPVPGEPVEDDEEHPVPDSNSSEFKLY
ncbi:MAG: DNA gyrase inhibitor YacG [Acidobacteriota bacterium]|nr:DNA gyrase inhibitor YacG [Acidobacteriota bacterium]